MSWLNSIGRVVTPLILTMQSQLLWQPRDEGMSPPWVRERGIALLPGGGKRSILDVP